MQIRDFPKGEWPKGLAELPQPPTRLWIRGAMPREETKLLAVVGSRALSSYGREACRSLIAGLSGYPISIVSGLALGTDACAHEAALAAGLHTIAIPGSGLDDTIIYPRANVPLAKRILEQGGALLSEQEPLHKPYLQEFPSRNRLMVGLSDAVLIIEAGEKSGTLITARLAGEYGKDLLCVPHRIGDPHGFGSNLFLRIGAVLVSDPLHILEALRIAPRESTDETRAAPENLSDAEKAVWEILEEAKTRDELVREAGDAGATLTALVSLEIRGLVIEEYGRWRRI